MTTIYADFRHTIKYSSATWNDITGTNVVGVNTADLLDTLGASTGVALEIVAGFNSSTAGAAWATADSGDFEEGVLDSAVLTSNGGTSTFKLTGLPVGATYTLSICGHNGNSRDSQYTIDAVDKDYIVGTAGAPTAATSFTGTVGGAGEISIDVTKAASGSFYGYANGFILEYTAATGLAIDSTDSTMQRGTNFEVVCSTPSTAPTTGNTTLSNGNDTLTPTSVTGSDPYTLTFPVGDLTKQVDATGYDWTLEITP